MEKSDLRLQTVPDETANVVEVPAAGIHLLITGKAVEKINPPRSFAMRVADNKSAEFAFSGEQPLRFVRMFHKKIRTHIPHVKRQPQVARIVQVMGGESVITFAEVRRHFLAGIKDARTGVETVVITEIGVDEEIGLFTKFHLVTGAQQFSKEILRLWEIRPEITEVEANPGHGRLGVQDCFVRRAAFVGRRIFRPPAGAFTRAGIKRRGYLLGPFCKEVPQGLERRL